VLLVALASACDACGGAARAGAETTGVARPTSPAGSTSSAVASSATGAAAPPPSAEDAPPRPARQLTWAYDKTEVGPMQVVVQLPAQRAGQRFPVLIALHGRGEAFKGPVRGARGWVDDYGLETALARLHAPPLSGKDLEGLASADRLGRMNDSLSKRAFGDMVVVCPYTPDILAGDKPFSASIPFGKLLVNEILPRVYRETPALGTPESTGIDGVSLGGRVAVLVGFDHPESFGAVAALQAAFDSADAAELTRRAKAAREKNPKLAIRLLTSDGDFFLRATKNISQSFRAAGIEHELNVIPGPHDYVFNRGPGVYEMLLFHDRTLRGRPMFD